MARAAALDGGIGIWAAGVRRVLRDTRLIVPVCILLICGSFAAAALLQMRLDRAHALSQATAFERIRAADLARVAGASLDRYARLGLLYADTLHPALARAEPAIRDIAVFDAGGRLIAALKGSVPRLPPAVFLGRRMLVPAGMAFRDRDRVIAVQFDPAGLVPAPLMTHAMLVPSDKRSGISAHVPGWPLAAVTRVDESSALASWYGVLPLYLFVILGPSLAGGWLATLFVGAFERHAKAARSLRALRSTRPAEARLMVRLAQAERGAVEALRAKSEFIAHMSHELRTPLNAVIGFSEIIAEGYYGPAGHPKYTEYARDIGQAGRHLHARIGDILEFANIEAGRYPLRPEPVDLAGLSAALIEEHQGRAFNRRIVLEMPFGEPGLVRADPQGLRRILANLIANALAYTGEGGWVRVEVHFEEGAGVLSVRDSGGGFSATERGRAGRAFQRFDRRGTVTGAGLGLAIAMELARRMGGAVRLAGEPGKGARMDVRLPKP